MTESAGYREVTTYLASRVINDSLIGHIALVAYEELVDALGRIAIDLSEPLLDILEGLLIGNVVHNADAVCAAVVGGCDSAETLLSGGIPLRCVSLCPRRPVWCGHTICNLTVLPSSSMVLIFWAFVS